MSDSGFVLNLLERGVLKSQKHPFHQYFAIAGWPLVLHEDEYREGIWGIYTNTYLIGVKAINREGLADVWPTLDFEALSAKGKELNDQFRNTSDC